MQTIIGGACFDAGFTNRGAAQVVRCVSHLLSGYLDEGDVDLGGAYPRGGISRIFMRGACPNEDYYGKGI